MKKTKAKPSKLDPLALLRQVEVSTMTIQSEQKSMISTRTDEDMEDTEDEGEEDEGREEEEEGEEGDSREPKEIGSGDTIFKTKDSEKSASIGKLHECYCNYKINIFDETNFSNF